MSISDQALFLLDIEPSQAKRQCLDSFPCLDPEISDSISPALAAPADSAPGKPPATGPASSVGIELEQSILASVQTPFAVASRMGRPDYEEKAKAEALHEALRQMRAKHANRRSPRVIRGT